MISRVLLMILAAAVAGCTHTRALEIGAVHDPARFETVNRELRDRAFTLALRDGRRIEARNGRFAAAGLEWHEGHTGAPRTSAATELREVSFRSRLRGALDGLLVGLVDCLY